MPDLFSMLSHSLRRRLGKLSLRGWGVSIVATLVVLGWVIMLFFDPMGDDGTRIAAVIVAIVLGFVLGFLLDAVTARLIVRLAGPLWRAILLVIVWIVVSFVMLVGLVEHLIPAAHSRAPLLTFTMTLVMIGALVVLAVPFIPVRSIHTGVKHGKNAFEELGVGGCLYAFLQIGGFFFGFGYTGFLVGLLAGVAIYPGEFRL